MKKHCLFLMTVLALLAVQPAEGRHPLEKKMGAYLFTFFNDPTHSLFMAVSYDGYTFNLRQRCRMRREESRKGRKVDALALGGDEGRDKLR